MFCERVFSAQDLLMMRKSMMFLSRIGCGPARMKSTV